MPIKKHTQRSGCPFVYFVDVFGDKWSLIIMRDIFFAQRQYYNDFLTAGEGIATNILADRLAKLEQLGLLKKTKDPENRRKNIYLPTAKALDIIPLLIDMIVWSAQYDKNTGVPPKMLQQFQQERSVAIAEIRRQFE